MQEPLASKYRPKKLENFVGQTHLTGDGSPIQNFIANDTVPSMIFWGPPGTGKTTLAYIISQNLFYDFHKLQAVTSGKDDLRKIIKIALNNKNYNRKTILFLDEIHRWNKAQQDALLPYVEKGLIILIGATTENPSFRINNALLSRTKVFIFEQHKQEDIVEFIKNVSKEEYGSDIKISKTVLEKIAELSNGDLRSALNILEMSAILAKGTKGDKKSITITNKLLEKAIYKSVYYDQSGEEHYNTISAIHKSLRSSNPDAACYWVTRMLEGGEDPLYIARRLLRFASEDIGNADPQAIILANTVYESCAKIGMPECDVFLMQLAIYLAKAPKDNTTYMISNETKSDVKQYGNLPVPKHFRNAPTRFMKDIGYGKGYQYDHDLKGKKSEQQCMPDKLKGKRYIKN